MKPPRQPLSLSRLSRRACPRTTDPHTDAQHPHACLMTRTQCSAQVTVSVLVVSVWVLLVLVTVELVDVVEFTSDVSLLPEESE